MFLNFILKQTENQAGCKKGIFKVWVFYLANIRYTCPLHKIGHYILSKVLSFQILFHLHFNVCLVLFYGVDIRNLSLQ